MRWLNRWRCRSSLRAAGQPWPETWLSLPAWCQSRTRRCRWCLWEFEAYLKVDWETLTNFEFVFVKIHQRTVILDCKKSKQNTVGELQTWELVEEVFPGNSDVVECQLGVVNPVHSHLVSHVFHQDAWHLDQVAVSDRDQHSVNPLVFAVHV